METRLQAATVADIGILAQLNAALIRDEGHRNPMSTAQLAERMQGFLQQGYVATLAQVGNEVAGYVLSREEPDYTYIRQLYVLPEYRRQSLGRKLYQHVAAQAKPRLRIDVLCANQAARHFWRALGFGDYCITMENNQPVAG